MENASKALIIAGAILISILLITIGIVLINSGRDIAETGTTTMTSQQMQIFNSQFIPYEGVITGRQVQQLYNVVQASNAAHPDLIVRMPPRPAVINENNYYRVTLQYSNGEERADSHNVKGLVNSFAVRISYLIYLE